MCFFNRVKSPQSLELSPLTDSARLNSVCNVLAFTDSLVGLPIFRSLSGVASSSSFCLSGVTWSLTLCEFHTTIPESPQYLRFSGLYCSICLDILSRKVQKSQGRVFLSLAILPSDNYRYMSYAITMVIPMAWSIGECQYFQLRYFRQKFLIRWYMLSILE